MAEQVHLTANDNTAQKNRRSNLIIFTLILLIIALIVAFFILPSGGITLAPKMRMLMAIRCKLRPKSQV